MTFSSHLGKKARTLLVCLFSLLMLASLCLATSAMKNEQLLLSLDPNDLTSLNGGNDDFTWDGSGSRSLSAATDTKYPGKVVHISKGVFKINDTKKLLENREAVAISADLYFSAFPGGTYAETNKTTGETIYYSADPDSEFVFQTQSVMTWYGSSFDGIRIDSKGNLYYGTGLNTALGVKLDLNTWYNLKLIHSKVSNTTEVWLNGKRVATVNVRYRENSNYVRFFDGRYTYSADIKNINISVTDTVYYSGLVKEASADFISYQTTKPASNGSFKLRVIAGVDELTYDCFGYKVLVLTKDAAGNTVTKELTGTDTIAYSSIYGGNTLYNIEEISEYKFACLATIENLSKNSGYTELVIYPYTVSSEGNKVYGTPITLVYTGESDSKGYPIFTQNNAGYEDILPTDDTYIYSASGHSDKVQGTATSLMVRNTGTESADLYRAAYFKFTVPKETVDHLNTMANVFLRVNIRDYEPNANRVKYPLVLFGASTGWDEDTLTYNTRKNAVRGEEIARIDGENCSGYITFDILNHLKKQQKNADGSITVAFCITQEDGHGTGDTSNTRMLYIYSKESGEGTRPYICFEETLYGHSPLNIKIENVGYEPLSYAESLVDTWFNELYPELYLDENGNVFYHDELGEFAPNGYAATEPTGDFTNEITWKAGLVWYSAPTPNKITDIVLHKDKWNVGEYPSRFARTLSTLGASTANEYLKSSYAKTTTQYDSYGGITNLGFKGTATGYFHTEKHTDGRTYVIDPLGNPYFAASINTLVYGTADTGNQQKYIREAYGTPENFFTEISADLRGMGINTAFVSSSDSLLAVKENGLSVTVSATGMSSYMSKLGRGTVSEGQYPNNNTINVFDPDFITYVNKENKKLIESKGYAEMDNLFAYTADNELPSGLTILERYLTVDPTIPENIFSYQTAWTWLGRKLNTSNPTLYDLWNLSAEEYNSVNSEFMGFLYANYYKAVGDSIRAADPNHMYIGSRVNGTCPYDEGYLRAAGKYLDIIAINLYGGLNPVKETISGIYKYSGKPFIVTEFFAKGMDTLDGNGYPLANSTGAGILVFQQEDRAAYYEHYVLNLLEAKSCVGWVWYRFRDNDQSLWTVKADDGTVYENVRFLSTTYGEHPMPNSLMLEDGTICWLSDLYSGDPLKWQDVITRTYAGEALASNQNVNKGFYNNNFSSVVTVYTYNADGTLRTFLQEDDANTTMDLDELLTFGSRSYEVKHPDSVNATTFTSTDGKTTFTAGKKTNSDGTYTVTKLTVYKGRYIALTDSVKAISDNLVGLIGYLDNN